MAAVEGFGDLLRGLRVARGYGVRELARRVPCSATAVSDLERGRRGVSSSLARRLDELVGAGGELVALLAPAPVDPARLEIAVERPGRADPAVVDHLAGLLATQRRLEDAAGSAPLVAPARAHLGMVTELIRGAPDGAYRTRLVDVGAQWAQFAAWLCTTTDAHAQGRQLYGTALEWATEAGNADMVATVLSMRGHLAWVTGRTRAMIELSRAACWAPASAGIHALAAQQEARGLAIAGDARTADDRLDRAEELIHQAVEQPQPAWIYFYDPAFFRAQRGLVQLYLGRYGQAIEHLTGALGRLPADIRASDWIGWYVVKLAEAYLALDERDQAGRLYEEAAATAERVGAGRLRGEVAQLGRQLGRQLSVS